MLTEYEDDDVRPPRRYWLPQWGLTNRFLLFYHLGCYNISNGRWVNTEYVYYPTTDTPLRLR